MATQKCSPKVVTVLFTILLTISTSGANQSLIYILQWTHTPDYSWIFWYLEMGQEAFILRNCSFQNCFITANRSYFTSILDFDVLLFNSVHLRHEDLTAVNYDIPLSRSEDQLYVFVGGEPAKFYPISSAFDGFFNLTWTYKLISDIVHPYFLVKNKFGNIIGPKSNVHWMDINHLALKNTSVERKLQRKSIAAAWVASNCVSGRLNFVESLKNELFIYGHRVDVYGQCGNFSCPGIRSERTGKLTECYSKIESDYYFYLAFENSITEDYVTEKVLHGLQHFAVPIVYGGADYTRFLPDGSYLNALKLGVKKLANEMNYIISNHQRYLDFFKWHGYYSFHEAAENRDHYSVCELCAFLNNEERGYKKTVYKYITHWWNAQEDGSRTI